MYMSVPQTRTQGVQYTTRNKSSNNPCKSRNSLTLELYRRRPLMQSKKVSQIVSWHGFGSQWGDLHHLHHYQSWAVVVFHVSYQAVILFVYLLPRGWIGYVINVQAFLAIHN